MAKIAVIDSQVAGIAGDMLVSALVDAGASASKVTDAIFACQNFLKGSKIIGADFVKVTSNGIAATKLDLKCSDDVQARTGSEMELALGATCDSVGLEHRAAAFAKNSLSTIIAAEARVHGLDPKSVHLHEASSIDTIADLVGAAVALQELTLLDAKIYSTRVAVGGGLLKFSHGTVPNPSSAILEIFKERKFVLVGGQAESELTTPTGAAMLVNLAGDGSVGSYPAIMPEAVGYGAGSRQFEGFANVVRVLVGSAVRPAAQEVRDTVSVVETNVDDVTGELVGNVVDRLAEVSKDVTVFPGMTKKGRPAWLIRVISENERVKDVLDVLFTESGTLGARVQQVDRIILPRTVVTIPVTIKGNTFNVHVKIARESPTGPINSVKPEFEDIKIIAARNGMPVRQTLDLVTFQVMEAAKRW